MNLVVLSWVKPSRIVRDSWQWSSWACGKEEHRGKRREWGAHNFPHSHIWIRLTETYFGWSLPRQSTQSNFTNSLFLSLSLIKLTDHDPQRVRFLNRSFFQPAYVALSLFIKHFCLPKLSAAIGSILCFCSLPITCLQIFKSPKNK